MGLTLQWWLGLGTGLMLGWTAGNIVWRYWWAKRFAHNAEER